MEKKYCINKILAYSYKSNHSILILRNNNNLNPLLQINKKHRNYIEVSKLFLNSFQKEKEIKDNKLINSTFFSSIKELKNTNGKSLIHQKNFNELNFINSQIENKNKINDFIYLNIKKEKINKNKIGIIKYKNGEKYLGERFNNIKEGYGIYHYLYGDKYEGEWKNDRHNGFGTYYYSNGNIYKGEWKNGNKEGFGILYYSNGSKYIGNWKNNEQDGYCLYYYSNGDKYEGECRKGEIDGYGIYYYSNGKKYEGEFKNNAINGYGIFYYSSGDKYQGLLKNNLKEGIGIYDFSYLKWRYEGEWKNDLRDGYGIQYFSKYFNYEGKWSLGKMDKFHYFTQSSNYLIYILDKYKSVFSLLSLVVILVLLA